MSILFYFFPPLREELPVSISIHSSRRDRQQAYSPIWIWGISPRQREMEERGEDPLVHEGVFWEWMQTLTTWFCLCRNPHYFKKGSIITDDGPTPEEIDTSLKFSFSPIDHISFNPPHSFLFSPTDHWVELTWDQIESTHSGNLSEAMYHLLRC